MKVEITLCDCKKEPYDDYEIYVRNDVNPLLVNIEFVYSNPEEINTCMTARLNIKDLRTALSKISLKGH